MINYDDIFALAKKTADALIRGNKPVDLEQSDLLNDKTKHRILKELSETVCEFQIEQLKAIDTNEGWKKVYSKINPNKKSSIKGVYKAAAVILLFVSIGYLTFTNLKANKDLHNEVSKISTGTDKAVLTLADGSYIFLEKGKTFKSGTFHSNGERLEYSRNNGSSKTVFNSLTIPRGGQYQIVLSDSTIVWLNADTKIKYPVNFVEGAPRSVELVYGEAYFDVSPSTKHRGNIFRVSTQEQAVEVVGTEFNIKAYNDEAFIHTTLVEGKVHVIVDEQKQLLRPGERTILDIATKNIIKQEVNVDHDIAWIRGYFNFKDKPLKDIMKVLSRWYDVEIAFEVRELEKIKFSGLLNRKQNIEDILNGIKNTKFINAYEIKNKTITIK